jgi:peptidyl-prolyl cis-trans isomerase A (cyclophilin A)
MRRKEKKKPYQRFMPQGSYHLAEQPVKVRRSLVLAFAAVLSLWLTCTPAPAAEVRVAIVTDRGEIDVALDPVHAPATVKNFLRYVDAKFYDGGTFFRAIPGFVIQGGDKARESSDYPPIPLEPPLRTHVYNKDGAISMARTSDPNSATSEFFICDGDQQRLDGSMTGDPGYAAFGHVVRGMNVVRAIARLPAQDQMLVAPVRIVRIYRLK